MLNAAMVRRTFAVILGGALIASWFAGFQIQNVNAASYEAILVSQSGSGTFSMQPDEVKEVTVEFLNSSDVTWENDGYGYLSVYTYDPKYRSSDFDPGTWLAAEQVKRIREAAVAPGETASVAFELHAPEAEGTYTETFKLAAEDIAWVDGGEFTFTIDVSEVSEQSFADTSEETNHSAELTVTSANRIKATAGRSLLLTAGFKNTGDTAWSDYGIQETGAGDVGIASSSISFAHPSWTGGLITYHENSPVAPGETAIVTFSFSAPDVNGTHTASFQFVADGEPVDEALINIPVEVTGGAAEAINADEIEGSNIRGEEPDDLRVGVLIVDEETDWEVVITSDESAFEMRDTEGNILAQLEVGQSVTAYYNAGHYYYDVGRGVETSTYGLRFIPETLNAVMTVSNFDMRVTRNAGNAYNTYRNILELRYNDYKDRTWLINELSMEMYGRGTGETSNASNEEFQKALMTAYRTYAYYHYTHGTKRGREFMHLISTADDQVYFGYEREVLAPTVTEAVEATRGIIVTYDDELAITPYFSRSDGRTRDWSEVWGGEVAWAKSVDVPCDYGKTMWGHGVGMSAQGALCMGNEGWVWDDILTYFYTDTELQQWWE